MKFSTSEAITLKQFEDALSNSLECSQSGSEMVGMAEARITRLTSSANRRRPPSLQDHSAVFYGSFQIRPDPTADPYPVEPPTET